MPIRVKAIPASGFRHGGLVAGPAWAPIAELNAKARATLRDFHGRFLLVHPDDAEKLGELGLAYLGPKEPLADKRATKKTTSTSTATTAAPSAAGRD